MLRGEEMKASCACWLVKLLVDSSVLCGSVTINGLSIRKVRFTARLAPGQYCIDVGIYIHVNTPSLTNFQKKQRCHSSFQFLLRIFLIDTSKWSSELAWCPEPCLLRSGWAELMLEGKAKGTKWVYLWWIGLVCNKGMQLALWRILFVDFFFFLFFMQFPPFQSKREFAKKVTHFEQLQRLTWDLGCRVPWGLHSFFPFVCGVQGRLWRKDNKSHLYGCTEVSERASPRGCQCSLLCRCSWFAPG